MPIPLRRAVVEKLVVLTGRRFKLTDPGRCGLLRRCVAGLGSESGGDGGRDVIAGTDETC